MGVMRVSVSRWCEYESDGVSVGMTVMCECEIDGDGFMTVVGG